ncbi:MAG: hypothetical protein JWP02_122, partial [Acidimicrobiales bacterium]|nr:hypothetical protein [Acidimicrobiales bacterium]
MVSFRSHTPADRNRAAEGQPSAFASRPPHLPLGQRLTEVQEHIPAGKVDSLNEQSDDRPSEILNVFYRVPRAGAERLSDGGGPFGFDITVALLVDDLITRCGCDALVETGCHLGDTTAYLATAYPQLPVLSCDIDPRSAAFTAQRVSKHSNITVTCQDSPA